MTRQPGTRLLFIEDDEESVRPAIRWLQRQPGYDCRVESFVNADDVIDTYVPDIIILDLLQSGSSGELDVVGIEVYERIWKYRFCPVVIYSAQPDLLISESKNHPFVRTVQKGAGSDARLEEVLSEFRPQVSALRRAEQDIRRELALALRDVAPHAFENVSDPDERSETVLRSARRRVAALMDDMARHDKKLLSWEQYLCPPVVSDLQLGDVLLRSGGSSGNARDFRVVLTPSCDLVSSSGRTPKVADVLVSRCVSPSDGIQLTSLSGIKPNKLKERMSSTVLSQGFFESILPLPALSGRIPQIWANLRDLELIRFGDIGGPERAYLRVASVDSPFREVVAWAYLQIACRPGLPERDFERWGAEIMAMFDFGSNQKS